MGRTVAGAEPRRVCPAELMPTFAGGPFAFANPEIGQIVAELNGRTVFVNPCWAKVTANRLRASSCFEDRLITFCKRSQSTGCLCHHLPPFGFGRRRLFL
jgi:hypothetical protein